MMKKRKGSVVDILPSMIMVIAAVILITVFFGLYQILSLNEDVKQISRKYMLTMETMGYLDAASRTRRLICTSSGRTEGSMLRAES